MALTETVVLTLLATGLLAGIVSGLLGVGGGILMVPALTLGLSLPFLEAKALSLFAILGTSVVGVATHRGFGNVDLRIGLLLGVSGVVGSAAGFVVSTLTPEPVFLTLFGLLLVAAAGRLWFDVAGLTAAAARDRGRAALFVVPVGLAAGFLAAFFGVGGGILFVPAMVLSGFPIHLAVGTSLAGVFVNGASGAALHAWGGYLDVLAGVVLMAGAVVGARAGALLANRLEPRRLRRVFAVALAVTGVYMALRPWVAALAPA